MRHKLLLGFAALALVFTVGAYAGYGYYAGLQAEARPELRGFAAASLNNAAKDSQQTFEKKNIRILINAAGSDSLYQQIVSGSPADVYMAADFKWLNQLKTGGLLYQDKYWNFTTKVLVVVFPSDNPKNVTSLLDFVKPGVRIVITNWSAPVGKYTNTTLTKIDSAWGNPTSQRYRGPEWENYRSQFIQNIVSYETSAEQVVGKVVLGNCDAAIAYASDAKTLGAPKLKQIQIPVEMNTLGFYAIGIVKTSNHPDYAMKYVEFWLSTDGQNLLEEYGFGQAISNAPSSDWTLRVGEGAHCRSSPPSETGRRPCVINRISNLRHDGNR